MANRIYLLFIISLIINPIFTINTTVDDFLEAVRTNNTLEIKELLDNPDLKEIGIDNLFVLACKENIPKGIETLFNFANFSQEAKDKSLYIASIEGYREVVKTLLKNGANPNNTNINQEKNIPLTEACYGGNLEIAKLLIENAPQTINHKNMHGMTPLMVAAYKNDLEIVRFLLENGADPTLKEEKEKNIPLIEACANGNLEIAKLLIENAPQTINQSDIYGMTPLIMATDNGDLEMVRFLLENGAEPAIGEEKGRIPLMLAIINESLEIAKLLLKNAPETINNQSSDHKTPLMLATIIDDVEMVRFFLENGADGTIKGESEEVPLMTAIRNNNLEIAKLLLENAPQTINQPNIYGMTPLIVAAYKGHSEMIRFLLANGADPTIGEKERRIPLMIATKDHELEIAKLLIENAPETINYRSSDHQTPLMIATMIGDVEMVRFLLKNGANPTIGGESQETPFMVAIANRNLEIAELLIENAPQTINQPNIYGTTPLMIATDNGDLKMVQFLLENGAEPTIGDKEGQAPLILATRKHYLEIAKLLLENAPKTINQQNIYGMAPLLVATNNSDLEMVQFLLENGADPTLREKGKLSTLFVLAINGQWNILKNILSSEKYKNQAKELFTQHKYGNISISDILNHQFKSKKIGKVTFKKFENISNISKKPLSEEELRKIEEAIKELVNSSAKEKKVQKEIITKKKKKKKKDKKVIPTQNELPKEEFKDLPGPVALSPSEAQHLLQRKKSNLKIHLTKALLQWENQPTNQLEKDAYFSPKTPRGTLFHKLERENGKEQAKEIIIDAHSLVPRYIIKYLVNHPLNAEIQNNLVKIYIPLTITRPNEQLDGTYELFFNKISTDEIIVYHSLFKDYRYEDFVANIPIDSFQQDSSSELATSSPVNEKQLDTQDNEWEHASQWTVEDTQDKIIFTDNNKNMIYTFSKD